MRSRAWCARVRVAPEVAISLRSGYIKPKACELSSPIVLAHPCSSRRSAIQHSQYMYMALHALSCSAHRRR